MTLNEIFENKKYTDIFEDCVVKTYNKYRMFNYYEQDDFYQECCIYTIPRLLNYDSSKCALKSYLYNIVTCCAMQVFKNVNGHSKKISKIQIERDSLKLDDTSRTSSGNYSGEPNSTFIKDDKLNLEDMVINKIVLEELPNLKTLTERQRIVVECLIEEKTLNYISELLDCSESNVRNLIVKIRKKLVKNYKVS